MPPRSPARLLSRCLGLLLLLAALWPLPALAELKRIGSSAQPEFLRAEEAFQVVPTRTPEGLALEFQVTPGYYLYRNRFRFAAEGSGLAVGTPAYSREGEWKDDPTFGRVQVHHESLTVTLPVTGTGTLALRWQGCADAGLCYPPQDRRLAVDATTVTEAPPPTPATAPDPTGRGTQLLVVFLLGVTLCFTPCVLPMLPIVAGIVARQHTSSALRGLLLALAYVLGMATVYALIGMLVALFGQQVNLPGWFQQPLVLITFALLFFALALSLFGLYELRLPVALTNHFHALGQRQQGGALAGSYVMGLFSALVVSPCVSAPLFGVLLHISTTGDAAFGALSLFLLALGMGLPLLVLGATEGRLLPKSGAWMSEVKTFFGFLLLFVGAELLTRLVPPPVALALYGVLAAALGLWLWRIGHTRNGVGLVIRATSFCGLAFAAALVAGALAGGDDPLRPLASFSRHSQAATPTPFIRVRTNADLDREIAVARQAGKPLMLDFYADWCVSCKVMERNVFRKPEVASRLARLHLVQADVTANNEDDRGLLKRFALLGPPTIVFFDKGGNELPQARLVGEADAEGFLAHLDQYGL